MSAQSAPAASTARSMQLRVRPTSGAARSASWSSVRSARMPSAPDDSPTVTLRRLARAILAFSACSQSMILVAGSSRRSMPW
jgi:hypothetical protein